MMSEESQLLIASGSGIQTVVPQLATVSPQVVYLDFDGAETSYNGEFLTIERVTMEDSGFDSEAITFIVDALNAHFDDDVVFTANLPQTDEYSTIYVGLTSAFDNYGEFLGLAETIDSGNKIHNDNAFVFLNSAASAELVTSVIAHETEHIVNGMEHDGEGLERYAAVTSTISSGQTSTGLVVSSGTTVNVLGVVNSMKVSSAGRVYVSSGGITNSMTLYYYGSAIVSNGGVANETMAISGDLYLYSGGVANLTTVGTGDIYIYSGGVANGIILTSYGWIRISGGIANSVTLNNNGRVIVGGGSVNSVTIASGADIYVHSGAIIKNAIVSSGGSIVVSDGGAVSNVMVSSGGSLVCQGLLMPAAYYAVLGNAKIPLSNASVVDSIYVSSGEIASNLTVLSSGCLNILSGGIVNKTTIHGGGSMRVSSGATVNSTIVSASNSSYSYKRGIYVVLNGGVANYTTINSNGYAYIDSGASASDVVVLSGGTFSVNYGGLASNVMISSGGSLIFQGVLIENASSYTFLDGNAKLPLSNVTIAGTVRLSSGDTAYGATINDGTMIVSSGGVVNKTTILTGQMYISNGGVANSTTLNAGWFAVYSGGIANEINCSRGWIRVESGGMVSAATISSGSMDVSRNGVANDTTIMNGSMYVSSGASANGVTVSSGGMLYVNSGGVASNVMVSSGAVVQGFLVNATTSYTLINESVDFPLSNVTVAGANAIVSSGKVASNVTIQSGVLSVLSGGTANLVTFASNWRVSGIVYNGGVANSTTVIGGSVFISSGGTMNMTILSGGSIYVSGGGTAINTIINSGYMRVLSGGMATSTIINGQSFIVDSGGIASGITFTDKVHDILYENGMIYCNGLCKDITIESKSLVGFAGKVENLLVKEGGVAEFLVRDGFAKDVEVFGIFRVFCKTEANVIVSASNVVIHSGANVDVGKNAYISDVIVESGGLLDLRYCFDEKQGTATNVVVQAGGSASASYQQSYFLGRLDIGGQVSVEYADTVSSTDSINFKLGNSSSSSYLYIRNGNLTTSSTITADVSKASGTYTLISGGIENLHVITVINNGVQTTVAVGETVTVANEKSVELSKKENELCLTVTSPDIPAPDNLIGNSAKLSWSAVTGGSGYVVEYSRDNFATSITVETETVGMAHFNLPSGTWQWRVKAAEGTEWAVGSNITISSSSTTPSVVSATADGVKDAFFVKTNGTWDSTYRARHMGVHNGWAGTGEKVVFGGENRFGDIFQGSTDENVLLLTDDADGDALFIDDVYTISKNDLGKTQARLAQIKEIRAGAGDDIVDLTSDKFDYTGGGLMVRGGLGDDTIWANAGNNTLFGDAGNDRLVGAGGNDIIVGGIGDDSMHGGGGDDIFAFGGAWGKDTVEQLSGGKVTLWFDSGSAANWNASTLTYKDGDKSVAVSGVATSSVTLKFGNDGSERYANLLVAGAFHEFSDERIFDSSTRGMLA